MIFIQLFFTLISFFTPADNNICRQPNTSYKEGEKIKYSIYYNVIGIYVSAGKAEFTTQLSSFEVKIPILSQPSVNLILGMTGYLK